MRNRPFLFIFLLFAFSYLPAQVPDSIRDLQFLTDTTNTELQLAKQNLKTEGKKQKKGIRKFLFSDYPSPGKAALLSFVIPGMGQVYNKKFWKVPIVYTGVGTMVYLIGKSGRNYKRFRTAYKLRVDDDVLPLDEFVDLYPQADRLKTIRDGYRKRREQAYIGLILALALSSADAFVDAHLLRFNVSDDLSIRVSPNSVGTAGLGQSYGFGLSFSLAN